KLLQRQFKAVLTTVGLDRCLIVFNRSEGTIKNRLRDALCRRFLLKFLYPVRKASSIIATCCSKCWRRRHSRCQSHSDENCLHCSHHNCLLVCKGEFPLIKLNLSLRITKSQFGPIAANKLNVIAPQTKPAQHIR